MVWRTRCPAKVNLFLAVGRPDPSGYHPIRTVFQSIGLYDDLEVRLGERAHEIACDWADFPAENTVSKTLRLLAEYVDVPPLRIDLTKRIPAQSGLGGGSSDAAGLLRLIRLILPETLSDANCEEIAGAVGADVPFFLVGGRARGDRYGDRVTPLPDGPRRWLAIVFPDEGVATATAYRALDNLEYEWRDYPEGEVLYNDFERVAPCVCGEIAERLLTHGASGASLSGSGSAVFGLFEEEVAAERAARRLRDETGYAVWVAPTWGREESLWTSSS
jgi:4-diphosphocytidyl-2-C-methyl-D-erythritol kinase